jgi:hypothetical protein
MYPRLTLIIAAALLLGADIPDASRFRLPLPGVPDLKAPANPADLPDIFVSVTQQPSPSTTHLGPQSRMEIIRYVDGEFAKVVRPLPGGKKGYKIVIGKKFDEQEWRDALRFQGTVAYPGDTVQITGIEFRGKEILVQINHGGKKPFHLRDHIQLNAGGSTVGTPISSPNPTPVDSREGNGTTIILDYGRALPDMSAEDLMHDLGLFLDFSKEHSAAVNWVDTLPPQFKEAIKDRQAVVGMNHDMVLAALGRPDHKVRERDPNGDQTEDWIYGTPPDKTTFVTFSGDKVIRVKEYN